MIIYDYMMIYAIIIDMYTINTCKYVPIDNQPQPRPRRPGPKIHRPKAPPIAGQRATIRVFHGGKKWLTYHDK